MLPKPNVNTQDSSRDNNAQNVDTPRSLIEAYSKSDFEQRIEEIRIWWLLADDPGRFGELGMLLRQLYVEFGVFNEHAIAELEAPSENSETLEEKPTGSLSK